MKFIDSHIHIEQLPWDALESMAISGLKAAISPVARPAVILGKHKKVLEAEEIIQFWDYSEWYGNQIKNTFFFHVFNALCIGSNSKINGFEELIKILPSYLKRDNVVALGELGLDPYQWDSSGITNFDKSKQIICEQIQIAKEINIPVIIHTPMLKMPLHYIKGSKLAADSPPWPFKKHFAEESIKLVNEVGLNHSLLLVDHADEQLVEYILNDTDAHVAISGGCMWRDMSPHKAANIVKRYGPKRIMIDSDGIGHTAMDPLWMAKAIREMKRLDMEEIEIKQVVVENPLNFFKLEPEKLC